MEGLVGGEKEVENCCRKTPPWSTVTNHHLPLDPPLARIVHQ